VSYDPTTDFLGLLRRDGATVELARIPGLDFFVSAMARAGLCTLSVGQVAPIVNQPNTVWFRPAEPSWTAEGHVFLWNALTDAYELATPALWTTFLTFSLSGYLFQAATNASTAVGATTSLIAVQREAPTATALRLPSVLSRGGKALQVADWSNNVTNHLVTLTPAAGNTIMKRASWALLSTADQLAGVTLYPVTELNGWVIAP
jgi:hypothetical protein